MINAVYYSVPNEYIMLKLIKYVKAKGINYSIYGFYMATEKPLDFKDFRFKASEYYLKFMGHIKIAGWLNNGFYAEFEKTNEIFKYYFRLKKSKGKIYLYINKTKYPLVYKLDLLKYFYKRKEAEFFEKDYNVASSIIDNSVSVVGRYNENFEGTSDGSGVHKNKNDWASFKNSMEKYKILTDDLSDRQNEGISDEDRKAEQVLETNITPHQSELDETKVDFNKNLDFETFYNYYFHYFTVNQKKICALLLLGIRVTDIARLMETTQVYVTLEVRRIAKKIRKLYKKTGKEFWLCQ